LVTTKKGQKKLKSLQDYKVEEKVTFFKKIFLRINLFLRKCYEVDFFRHRINALRIKLEYAGISDEVTPEEYFSFYFIGGTCGFILSIISCLALMKSELGTFGPSQSIILILLFTGFGILAPSLKLNELIKARKKAIIKALPFTLDLITLSVEAGLDFSGAVQRIIEKSEMNELVYEFYLFLHETKLGKRKVDALKRMADRINVPFISSIISSLIQAEELGIRIAQILKIQSGSLRIKRMQRSEKAAMEAPVKMLIPLALFIFPAVFIVLLGPILIQFIK